MRSYPKYRSWPDNKPVHLGVLLLDGKWIEKRLAPGQGFDTWIENGNWTHYGQLGLKDEHYSVLARFDDEEVHLAFRYFKDDWPRWVESTVNKMRKKFPNQLLVLHSCGPKIELDEPGIVWI